MIFVEKKFLGHIYPLKHFFKSNEVTQVHLKPVNFIADVACTVHSIGIGSVGPGDYRPSRWGHPYFWTRIGTV